MWDKVTNRWNFGFICAICWENSWEVRSLENFSYVDKVELRSCNNIGPIMIFCAWNRKRSYMTHCCYIFLVRLKLIKTCFDLLKSAKTRQGWFQINFQNTKQQCIRLFSLFWILTPSENQRLEKSHGIQENLNSIICTKLYLKVA